MGLLILLLVDCMLKVVVFVLVFGYSLFVSGVDAFIACTPPMLRMLYSSLMIGLIICGFVLKMFWLLGRKILYITKPVWIPVVVLLAVPYIAVSEFVRVFFLNKPTSPEDEYEKNPDERNL